MTPVGSIYPLVLCIKTTPLTLPFSIRWVSVAMEEVLSGRICATVSDSSGDGGGCPTVHPLSLTDEQKV